jgi:hypothetical protein
MESGQVGPARITRPDVSERLREWHRRQREKKSISPKGPDRLTKDPTGPAAHP